MQNRARRRCTSTICLKTTIFLIFLGIFHRSFTVNAVPNLNPFSRHDKSFPQVPSTLLKLHKIYTSHPPHDTQLYQTLRVSPNATTAEIQKSYRKLSRQWHPDKQPRHSKQQRNAHEQLEKLQKAYEILKDDSTRLLYHKYGLQDVYTAVHLLTGYQNTNKLPTREEIELMQWMGFSPSISSYNGYAPTKLSQEPSLSPQQPTLDEQQQQRVQFLAATILERIRPLVEGTLSERDVADSIVTECDRLKRLPLGANILRCVGRAYRHAGQRYYARKKHTTRSKTKKSWSLWPIRDTWHDAQHVLSAAVASGRVVLKENWLIQQAKKDQKVKDSKKPKLSYYSDSNSNDLDSWFYDDDEEEDNDGIFSSDDDEEEEDYLSDQELQQQEVLKSEKVLVELLQIEALWKVHKVGLNRVVKKACELILSGEYFFFPSHQSMHPTEYSGADGWVAGHAPHVIDAEEAKDRAASALIMIGNLLVQASKEDTAWME